MESRVVIPMQRIAAAAFVLEKEWEEAANVRALAERTFNGVRLSIEARMLAGGKEVVTWTVYRPSTWWQHFKRDVLVPLTKHPSTGVGRRVRAWAEDVEEEKLHFEQSVYTRFCPHIAVPDQRTHIEFVLNDRDTFAHSAHYHVGSLDIPDRGRVFSP